MILEYLIRRRPSEKMVEKRVYAYMMRNLLA